MGKIIDFDEDFFSKLAWRTFAISPLVTHVQLKTLNVFANSAFRKLPQNDQEVLRKKHDLDKPLPSRKKKTLKEAFGDDKKSLSKLVLAYSHYGKLFLEEILKKDLYTLPKRENFSEEDFYAIKTDDAGLSPRTTHRLLSLFKLNLKQVYAKPVEEFSRLRFFKKEAINELIYLRSLYIKKPQS